MPETQEPDPLTPLSEEDLQRLEQLEQQATKGPWKVADAWRGRVELSAPRSRRLAILADRADEDGAFIAEWRNAAPSLLTELRRLRAENEILKELLVCECGHSYERYCSRCTHPSEL